MYMFTSIVYGHIPYIYKSYFLALAGQTIPNILLASVVSSNCKYQRKMKKVVPYVSVIFTFMSIAAVFFPTGQTSLGYVDNDNGLDYQSSSYMAAYSAGFIFYYIINFNNFEWDILFKQRISQFLMTILLFINIITVLFSGGRGGFVVLFSQIVFNLILIKHKIKKIKLHHLLLSFFLLSTFVLFFLDWYQQSSIDTYGLERIIWFIQEHEDEGRGSLWKVAMKAFSDNPLLGHGIGSVFYEVGHYSHNFFIDVLVETGLVGLVVFVIILIRSFLKLWHFAKMNISDSLWLMIFTASFVNGLFSGYYLAQFPFWWSLIFIIGKKNYYRVLVK